MAIVRKDNICGAYSKPDAKLTKKLRKTRTDAEKMGMSVDEFVAYKSDFMFKALKGEITMEEFNAAMAEIQAKIDAK